MLSSCGSAENELRMLPSCFLFDIYSYSFYKPKARGVALTPWFLEIFFWLQILYVLKIRLHFCRQCQTCFWHYHWAQTLYHQKPPNNIYSIFIRTGSWFPDLFSFRLLVNIMRTARCAKNIFRHLICATFSFLAQCFSFRKSQFLSISFCCFLLHTRASVYYLQVSFAICLERFSPGKFPFNYSERTM